MRATTGSGRLKTSLGPRDIRLLVIKGAGDKVFRLAFITPPKMTQKLGEAFRRTTYSFRRLSRVEAKSIHPLKVRLTKVRAGDSVKSLSKHMPFTRFKYEWLRMLNGLSKGDHLTVDQQLKIISD